MILLVAPSTSPTIIYGPTGSGKGLVAECLHEESRRKGPMVTLNCAAIPKDLIEAELFGFEKVPSRTLRTTPGKFEQAQNGTLFLDEIGDIPMFKRNYYEFWKVQRQLKLEVQKKLSLMYVSYAQRTKILTN